MIDKVQFNKVDLPNRNERSENLQYVPEDFKNVARGMETQFLEFMINQMNKTVDPAEEKSSAQNYYESILTNERAKAMAKKNDGNGIQKMILDQIYPTRFRNKNAYDAYVQRNKLQDKHIIKRKMADEVSIRENRE